MKTSCVLLIIYPSLLQSVYPPIHSTMHKLFSEQETERIRLAAALLSEQVCVCGWVSVGVCGGVWVGECGCVWGCGGG